MPDVVRVLRRVCGCDLRACDAAEGGVFHDAFEVVVRVGLFELSEAGDEPFGGGLCDAS